MAKHYSMDRRQCAIARLATGEATYEVAEALSGVPVGGPRRWYGTRPPPRGADTEGG